MKNHQLLKIVLAVGASLGVSTAALADVVKIATVIPKTGSVTQYGDLIREGVQTAVEKLNANGGVDGHTFEMVEFDDACEPSQAAVAANKIVNDNIKFVVGPTCSGATIAAAPVFEEQEIVMITPSATAPAVTRDKKYHFIFRTIGRDDQQIPAAVEYVLKHQPKKIAILHDKQSFGLGLATTMRDLLEEKGIEPAIFEAINAGEPDYSAIITRFKAEGIDFVYYGGYHPELGLLLRQAQEQDFKARFMAAEGAGNLDINAIAGEASEGFLLTFPRDFSKNPENQSVVADFKAKGRDASGAYQLPAYAAVQAIAAAIHGTQSTDSTKVADWLHQNTVSSVIGDLQWQESGDLVHFDFDVLEWHKDGSSTLAD